MGLLLLLTSSLLSSYFHAGRVVNAQRSFTIREVTLSIEPSTDVTRDTNVTLRCQAIVSSSGQEPLSREYTIYKDGSIIYNKISSSSEDLLYFLPQTRVFNSGKYKCKINIDGKQVNSSSQKLTVTGLSQPLLRLNKGVVSEGEEITAKCSAPGETGSIFFYFYEDSKEILERQVSHDQAEVKFHLRNVGIHKIHCDYTVLVTPYSFKSEKSNNATVTVKELSITPVLEIFPSHKIYEGDRLTISCTITNSRYNFENVQLYLSQGVRLLSSGDSKVNHSMVALAQDPGEFECRLEIGNVVKVDKKNVSVTELFSVPTLTMSPAEVFQRDSMTLTCRSERYATERLRKEELIYSINPPESYLLQKDTGVFRGKALPYDFNYTCTAKAKGIDKNSTTLTVRPKVSVSIPRIRVEGRAVLGRPFIIRCQSDIGSLPINYTLWKGYDVVDSFIVKSPSDKADFSVTIFNPGEISQFMCQATNKPEGSLLGKRLNATVIVPLSDPTMTVIPNVAEISEGDDLILICRVDGTPPVHFNWYRRGTEQPLFNRTSNMTHSNHQIPSLSKTDSGAYYCEAVNYANNVVRSQEVVIEVRMALWKKVTAGAVSLLGGVVLVVVVVVVMVLCRSKKGKREAASELSVKPSSPKSDDSLTVNLTHDTEVYNADKDAAPLYNGTEGRVANGARDSAASLPADISNRSSYSTPATV